MMVGGLRRKIMRVDKELVSKAGLIKGCKEEMRRGQRNSRIRGQEIQALMPAIRMHNK